MSESHLKNYQQLNKARTVELVRSTIAIIESELASGTYPHNSGRLNRREFCRRAGLGESTLKNSTHSETSALVTEWLRGVVPASARRTEIVPENGTKQLAKIARELNLFKLLYEDLAAENKNLRLEIARLSGEPDRQSPPHLKLVSE